MEVVVSPLTLTTEATVSSKRRFASSPCENEEDVNMMDHTATTTDSQCFNPSVKRRRKNDYNDGIGSSSAWMSPFAMAAGGGFAKRSRSRSPPANNQSKLLSELQGTISTQSIEISTLKSQYAQALSHNTQLESHNAQLSNENKILKRAVGIQQERQSSLMAELEEAKRVNEEAATRVGRLEQMNLTLRYQLEAFARGSSSSGFHQGPFDPRPPDVY